MYIQKFDITYLVMQNVHLHIGAISWLECGLCICTGDNPLAEVRGSSSRTDVQTSIQLLLVACDLDNDNSCNVDIIH